MEHHEFDQDDICWKCLMHNGDCSPICYGNGAKPQDNPKEGDMEEIMWTDEEMKIAIFQEYGRGYAAGKLDTLGTMEQIRIAALNAAVSAGDSVATFSVSTGTSCKLDYLKTAKDFENYILNGTQEDREKQDA